MKSQNKNILNGRLPFVTDDTKRFRQMVDAIVCKVSEMIDHIHTVSVEPGVEIVGNLSIYIDTLINGSVRLDYDLSVTIVGILVGVFRSSPFMRQEAHKTIHLLVDEILRSVFKYNGDVKKTVDGLLTAIIVVAEEQKLNISEALAVVVEDTLSSSRRIDSGFAEQIKINIPNEYDGLKIPKFAA